MEQRRYGTEAELEITMNRKYATKAFYIRKWLLLMDKVVDPMYSYWYRAKQHYRNLTGKKLDYHHPHDINEKLMWLTRYWQHPLKTKCADKYLVREYVKACGLEEILVPLIAVYDNANDIDFEHLPNSFVLKCNHGSGFNIIVRDKSTLDPESTRKKLNEWMSIDFDTLAQEIHYHDIPHKIVCEELISNRAPLEFQCWCINNKVDSLLVCRKNDDGTYDAWSYSTSWEHLCERKSEDVNNDEIEKPKNLSTILEYATKLSKPFPFVRADFYLVNNIIYFAELTFTPATNILSSYKDEFICRLGSNLTLPPKYIPQNRQNEF